MAPLISSLLVIFSPQFGIFFYSPKIIFPQHRSNIPTSPNFIIFLNRAACLCFSTAKRRDKMLSMQPMKQLAKLYFVDIIQWKKFLFKTVLPPPEDRSMSKANELFKENFYCSYVPANSSMNSFFQWEKNDISSRAALKKKETWTNVKIYFS